MRFALASLAVACLLAATSGVGFAAQAIPQADDFESYALGAIFTTVAAAPEPKSDVWADSATFEAGLRYSIVETAQLDGNPNNQVAHIVDANTALNKNTHLRTNFWDVSGKSSGVYDVWMDIEPLQTNGPFKVTLTNGPGWTSGFNWVAAVAFGSDAGNTFFPGMTTGAKLGLQTTTTAWVDTSTAYLANTWYTVRFGVDVDNRLYQVFFGLHGGPLNEVTNGWTNRITGATTPPTTFGGTYVATSNKTGEGAELLFDSVEVTPEPASPAALVGLPGLVPVLRRRK